MAVRFYNVPIEPIANRYSTQWATWFKKAIEAERASFIEIGSSNWAGKALGGFLDFRLSAGCKTSQAHELCYRISDHRFDDHVVFFHDIWHPAITTLLYLRSLADIRIKIVGILHAGSYVPTDLMAKHKAWAAPLEWAWFGNADLIFVATGFHRVLVEKFLGKRPWRSRIVQTYFPVYDPSGGFDHGTTKTIDVVFPHRLSPEKQPDLATAIAHPFKLVRTMDYNDGAKDGYHAQLLVSKVALSTALEETFGIAMVEATMAGCIPLVPHRLSYLEQYPDELFYRSPDQASKMLRDMVHNYGNWWYRLEDFRKELRARHAPVDACREMIRQVVELGGRHAN